MPRADALVVLLMLSIEAPAVSGAEPTRSEAEVEFEMKVRPVLAGVCFACHGGKKTSGGLRVDSREALVRGGEHGPALKPGDPAASLIVRALRHLDDDVRMPPGKRLPDAVAEGFAAWIARGAPWPKASPQGFSSARHWAFEPLRTTGILDVPSTPGEHPIDRFVGKTLRDRGIRPNGPADRRTLIRRLTFDLVGLPPTPEEIAAFLADGSPAAVATLADRLLASPRYGERWGRYWLDLARYADTAGDNADYPIPEARLYRDCVIEAFNSDKPYDQFVQEQLAGDLLARDGPREAYAERVAATGFLALSRRYATAPGELWHLTLEDAIETTGRTFLGLTLRCARCHDHKFDPIAQRDYYALYGIFASTRFPYAGSEEFQSKGFPRADFSPLIPERDARPLLERHESRLRELRDEIHRLESGPPGSPAELSRTERIASLAQAIEGLEKVGQAAPAFRDQLARLRDREGRLGRLRETLRSLERPGLPSDLPGAYAVAEGSPVHVPIHVRGEPGEPGPTVPRGTPELPGGPPPPAIPQGASGRLELARWLTRPDHPLTARVMVNRIWQHHFGRGLVASASNFGLRGDDPTHPELLDWLARRFITSGWSVKAMHRLIVSSDAYQRSSGHGPDAAARDPGNRGYWRFDRRRLDAEAIRDALLAVAGNLDPNPPGTHPFPPIAQWAWTQHSPFKAVYSSNHRSVYLMTQRLQRHPYLALFDGPDTNHSTDVRPSSIVPLQALYLLNNPFVQSQAEGLARRLLADSSSGESRIARGVELAWGRPPTPLEVETGLAFVEASARELARAGAPAPRVEWESWTRYARILLLSSEFLYID